MLLASTFFFQKLSQVPPLHEIAEKHISTKAVLWGLRLRELTALSPLARDMLQALLQGVKQAGK